MSDDISAIVARIAAGRHSQADLDALVRACQAGQIAVVTGERAVAMGRDATDTVIVTGDNNIVIQVLHGRPAETVRQLPLGEQAAPSAPRSGVNPFENGPAVPPERFYGRDAQRADIKSRIGGISAQCISIVGARRSGKSSLLRYVNQRIGEFCQDDQRPLPVSIDLQYGRFHTPLGLLEGLRRAIEQQLGSAPWEREQNANYWAVDDGLEAIRDSGRRLIVLLDEFERIGVRLEQFQDWGEDWRAKASAGCVALVIATTRPLPEIYRACGLTSPFDNIFTTTILGAFTDAEQRALVHDGFVRGGAMAGEPDLDLVDDLAGGVPYYTQMAAALLWQHGEHARVRDLFARQAEPRFAELWDDLTPTEHLAVRHAAGMPRTSKPKPNLRERLHDYGLLRADGRLFSSAFAAFVRGRQ